MAFYKFYDILKIQKSILVKRDPIDIDIYNLILSLEIITSGLKGTKFVPWKPIYIFSLLKIMKNTI